MTGSRLQHAISFSAQFYPQFLRTLQEYVRSARADLRLVVQAIVDNFDHFSGVVGQERANTILESLGGSTGEIVAAFPTNRVLRKSEYLFVIQAYARKVLTILIGLVGSKEFRRLGIMAEFMHTVVWKWRCRIRREQRSFCRFYLSKAIGVACDEERNWLLGNESFRKDLEHLNCEIARPDAIVIVPAATQNQLEGLAQWYEAIPEGPDQALRSH